MKLYVFQHGVKGTNSIAEADEALTTRVLYHITNGNADAGKLPAYIKYQQQYNLTNSADTIRFLIHSNVCECGTIEEMEMDYFWVSDEQVWRNDEGNWLYNGYMLGCDKDTIDDLVTNQNWTASACIDMVMENLVYAISLDD